MDLTRRSFLAGGAAIAAAAASPSRLLAALESHTPPPSRLALSRWPDVRAQFALTREYRHFSHFFIASHPKPVRDAIDGYRKAIDANPFLTVEHGLFEDDLHGAVCTAAAGYLGGKPEEVAVVGNTTTGLALVYHGLPLQRDDEILTTTHDHYSHDESIRLAAARAGASVRKVALYDRGADADTAEIVRRLRAAIRPKTRAVGVTWVHSSTGVRLPLRRIAEAVAEANRGRAERDRALLVVDGVHGLGAIDETVATMGCDYFCSGAHKWLFAPRGTGIVWARPEAWARLRPTIPSFTDFDPFMAWMNGKPLTTPVNAKRMTPGGFTAFEHQWAMVAAFRFHETMGRDRVAFRIRQLNDQLKDGLAAIPRLRLHTPRDPGLSAGIVAFEVDGVEPDAIVKRLLERKIIASTSPYNPTYARLSPSLVNDEADVDAAIGAVKTIADRSSVSR